MMPRIAQEITPALRAGYTTVAVEAFRTVLRREKSLARAREALRHAIAQPINLDDYVTRTERMRQAADG